MNRLQGSPNKLAGNANNEQGVKLYIMCGLPFSGKTTLAKELARQFGFTRIAMDEINTERGLGLDGKRITPQQWVETYNEMYWRVRGALSRGETVVLDAPSFTRGQRREVETIAADYVVASRIIYVAVPEVEARRRWQENRRLAERHDVRDDDFELAVRNFEPPDLSENALVFDQSANLEEWIRSTFS
jgi:predicted kinase